MKRKRNLERERFGMTQYRARQILAEMNTPIPRPYYRPLDTMHPLALVTANPYDVIQNRVMRAYHADRYLGGARDALAVTMWRSYDDAERQTNAARAGHLKRFMDGHDDDDALKAFVEHMDRRQAVINESV